MATRERTVSGNSDIKGHRRSSSSPAVLTTFLIKEGDEHWNTETTDENTSVREPLAASSSTSMDTSDGFNLPELVRAESFQSWTSEFRAPKRTKTGYIGDVSSQQILPEFSRSSDMDLTRDRLNSLNSNCSIEPIEPNRSTISASLDMNPGVEREEDIITVDPATFIHIFSSSTDSGMDSGSGQSSGSMEGQSRSHGLKDNSMLERDGAIRDPLELMSGRFPSNIVELAAAAAAVNTSHDKGVDEYVMKAKPMHRRNDSISSFNSLDGGVSSRGKYKCGRCGQPKTNHRCPFTEETVVRDTETQTESLRGPNNEHPFTLYDTITVSSRAWTSERSESATNDNDGGTPMSVDNSASSNFGIDGPSLTSPKESLI